MRDKILAMETGKLLDHLIAEDVMGWTRKGDCWFTTDGNVRTDETTSYKSFQPSTDISSAMEVVEKIKGNYDCIQLIHTNGLWTCSIISLESLEDYRSVEHESKELPEAISKAALLAVIES